MCTLYAYLWYEYAILKHVRPKLDYCYGLSRQGEMWEGPSAARRGSLAIGCAEFLGPAVYSGFRVPAVSRTDASR